MAQSGCTIEVTCKPNARHDCIKCTGDSTLSIAVSSPPHDGKANVHAVKLLAQALHIPRSSIDIKLGQSSRRKLFVISGMKWDDVRKRIDAGKSAT